MRVCMQPAQIRTRAEVEVVLHKGHVSTDLEVTQDIEPALHVRDLHRGIAHVEQHGAIGDIGPIRNEHRRHFSERGELLERLRAPEESARFRCHDGGAVFAQLERIAAIDAILADGVDRMPPRPTMTRPNLFPAAILRMVWTASRL